MIEKTSTEWAPWILVEGDSKRFARDGKADENSPSRRHEAAIKRAPRRRPVTATTAGAPRRAAAGGVRLALPGAPPSVPAGGVQQLRRLGRAAVGWERPTRVARDEEANPTTTMRTRPRRGTAPRVPRVDLVLRRDSGVAVEGTGRRAAGGRSGGLGDGAVGATWREAGRSEHEEEERAIRRIGRRVDASRGRPGKRPGLAREAHAQVTSRTAIK